METKMITIPFDLERAKRIQEGKEKGRILTKNGNKVRIVYWNLKDPTYCIVAIVHILPIDCEICKYYNKYGQYDAENREGYNQDIDTLILQVPEYTQYKDGDILIEKGGKCPFIFKGIKNDYCDYYVGINSFRNLIFGKNNTWCYFLEIGGYANEEQKQRLINALQDSKEPLAKEYLKRFFNIEKEEFKPFDKVLVRDKGEDWKAAFFSHYSKISTYPYFTIGTPCYEECIPYNEETKHLLGTNKNWENKQ